MNSTVDRGDASLGTDVTVLVVNYNTAHLLKDMVAPLRAAEATLSIDTIVIDNASRDDSVAFIQREPELAHVRLIENAANVGFGRANNQGVPFARGRYVLLLNTDAFVEPDTLAKTVAFLDATPDCGVLGVRLLGRDGHSQPSCRYFPTPWNVFLNRSGLSRWFPGTQLVDDSRGSHDTVRECDWVPGCYLLIRREVIQQVGLFDPRYFLYSEEVDFCHAVKAAGWKVVYYPHTHVVHWGGESAKSDAELTAGQQISDLQIESELLYFRKHHGRIGVTAFVLLSSLADLLNGLKWILRQRAFRGLQPLAEHASSVVGLFARTRMGKVSTR